MRAGAVSTEVAEHDSGPTLGVVRRLDRRVAEYHGVGAVAGLTGWALWVRCARNAAWARLVAKSWDEVAESTATGLLLAAAYNSVHHYDTERERWRSLASTVPRDHRCRVGAEGSGDPCTLTAGHPGGHADPTLGGRYPSVAQRAVR